MVTKKSEIDLAAELNGLMEPAAKARAILSADLSHLDPAEAADIRETAQSFLAQVDTLMELLSKKDEQEAAIDSVNRLLKKNYTEFWGYSLRGKIRFIRVFLIKWVPLKVSGKLKKL